MKGCESKSAYFFEVVDKHNNTKERKLIAFLWCSLESFDDTEYNTAITPWGQAEAFEVIDGPLIILLIIALSLGIFSFARSFGV